MALVWFHWFWKRLVFAYHILSHGSQRVRKDPKEFLTSIIVFQINSKRIWLPVSVGVLQLVNFYVQELISAATKATRPEWEVIKSLITLAESSVFSGSHCVRH